MIKKEDLSDEDMFICFMIVALSSFLCPITNTVLSPKYFGIFEDVEHIKDFKWCAYVLHWLLEHVKAFNGGKDDKAKCCLGLGGCLYYLAVSFFFNCRYDSCNTLFLVFILSISTIGIT